MKKSRFLFTQVATASILTLMAACTNVPQTPKAVPGNPYIQKLGKGQIQVVGASLAPENAVTAEGGYSYSGASLRAVIEDGYPRYAYRVVSYVSPGSTRDFGGLDRAYLEQQAAMGGLRVILPAKNGVQYYFSPQYIRSFLIDVDTATNSPIP